MGHYKACNGMPKWPILRDACTIKSCMHVYISRIVYDITFSVRVLLLLLLLIAAAATAACAAARVLLLLLLLLLGSASAQHSCSPMQ